MSEPSLQPDDLNDGQDSFPQFEDAPHDGTYRDVENSLFGNATMYLAALAGAWFTYAALVAAFGTQLEQIVMPRAEDDIKHEQVELEYATELKTQLPYGYAFACPACGKAMAKSRSTAHCNHCGNDVDLKKSIPKVLNTLTMRIEETTR